MRKLKFYICKVLTFLLNKLSPDMYTPREILPLLTLLNNNNPTINTYSYVLPTINPSYYEITINYHHIYQIQFKIQYTIGNPSHIDFYYSQSGLLELSKLSSEIVNISFHLLKIQNDILTEFKTILQNKNQPI